MVHDMLNFPEGEREIAKENARLEENRIVARKLFALLFNTGLSLEEYCQSHGIEPSPLHEQLVHIVDFYSITEQQLRAIHEQIEMLRSMIGGRIEAIDINYAYSAGMKDVDAYGRKLPINLPYTKHTPEVEYFDNVDGYGNSRPSVHLRDSREQHYYYKFTERFPLLKSPVTHDMPQHGMIMQTPVELPDLDSSCCPEE